MGSKMILVLLPVIVISCLSDAQIFVLPLILTVMGKNKLPCFWQKQGSKNKN
ncbi:hypothetical protein TMU01_06190 [Tenuibacillus multivorans]|nr:hypothetical protein TMU01_06190 [Tenuibacillus multivorans]